jgi:hypothetical protein
MFKKFFVVFLVISFFVSFASVSVTEAKETIAYFYLDDAWVSAQVIKEDGTAEYRQLDLADDIARSYKGRTYKAYLIKGDDLFGCEAPSQEKIVNLRKVYK